MLTSSTVYSVSEGREASGPPRNEVTCVPGSGFVRRWDLKKQQHRDLRRVGGGWPRSKAHLGPGAQALDMSPVGEDVSVPPWPASRLCRVASCRSFNLSVLSVLWIHRVLPDQTESVRAGPSPAVLLWLMSASVSAPLSGNACWVPLSPGHMGQLPSPRGRPLLHSRASC